MEELVITCSVCGAVKSIAHVEDGTLTLSEVIALAGHTPGCALIGGTNVFVERDHRPGEPQVSLYTLSGGA